ncbi:DUF4870 domain-containing protein [Sphingobacterium cellulitidis]|uniref:DUF4870 domain-containing protein n=1 Tax=Sphingobacterium cellulitidis TaxID=1768011 RepID=UPI000B93E728|nr:hypothetical protein CHT99_13055 [Sphingobacterium cellulitidis]
MEHIEGAIDFNPREITEDEREYASNSYLMSLFALFIGLPLPIFNLLATVIFYLGKRKSTSFVRWHCTQALISQFSIFFFNTAAFWWTIAIILHKKEVSDSYISYLILIFILNGIEVISTIYTSIQTRKGIHVRWFLFSDITDNLLKK